MKNQNSKTFHFKLFTFNSRLRRAGFTLIELLIVIAIIAILASVIFVALDPLKRFRDSRDARRWSDVRNIVDAIKLDQVDNGGSYVYGVGADTAGASTIVGDEYMILNSTTTDGCNSNCITIIAASNDCVNLQDLVTEGYLGELPVSPTGSASWSLPYTGYYLTRNASSSGETITIGSCEAENASSISVTR